MKTAKHEMDFRRRHLGEARVVVVGVDVHRPVPAKLAQQRNQVRAAARRGVIGCGGVVQGTGRSFAHVHFQDECEAKVQHISATIVPEPAIGQQGAFFVHLSRTRA